MKPVFEDFKKDLNIIAYEMLNMKGNSLYR